MEPAAFTIREFCRIYGISERSAYNLRDKGKLVFKKMGARTLIMADSARAWFDELPVARTHALPPTPARTHAAIVQADARPRKAMQRKGK